MKTMGLESLYIVRPRQFPHPDADARASGALELLRDAHVCSDLAAALRGCALAVATSSRQRELRHELLAARDAVRELLGHATAQPVALVFGNETTGLTKAEAALCQLWAYIPANPAYASLNLAAAVQVFAYELRIAADYEQQLPKREFELATTEQVEALSQHFEQTMLQTGFLDPKLPKRLMPRLRRLLARARLEEEEVNILRGFLRSVERLGNK
jgi:tRNA/rRNA methyltransferase